MGGDVQGSLIVVGRVEGEMFRRRCKSYKFVSKNAYYSETNYSGIIYTGN